MKGIILAGGKGSRLYPLTEVVTKQLQPIYNKPMIYYPLSMLMLSGIKEVMIICNECDKPLFEKLLGDGSQFGISLEFKVQDAPNGLPEAFILGEEFIAEQDVCLLLGDNIFYGDFDIFRTAYQNQLAKENDLHARVFAYKVTDPERYGVVDFDPDSKRVVDLEEKPTHPKSPYAIPGFYFFDKTVSRRSKELRPSPRGELEIIDLMQSYLDDNSLAVEILGRGIAWLDTGTPESLCQASDFVAAVEQRQGFK
ncbi:MAG: NTP transferase domain-containing protein, partial [Halobacteriovoraceae bacterium]|nr:NTP transferase domain-containing protein [Halobacteriovoraceae bacterium]